MTRERAVILIAEHNDCSLGTPASSEQLVIISQRQRQKLTLLVEDLAQIGESDFLKLLDGKVRGLKLPRYSLSVI